MTTKPTRSFGRGPAARKSPPSSRRDRSGQRPSRATTGLSLTPPHHPSSLASPPTRHRTAGGRTFATGPFALNCSLIPT
jgi:hypothetical protein